MTVELAIPQSLSLKDKRRSVRSLIDKIRASFNASVLEVEHRSELQHATVGVAVVCVDGKIVDAELSRIFRLVESQPGIIVMRHERETI